MKRFFKKIAQSLIGLAVLGVLVSLILLTAHLISQWFSWDQIKSCWQLMLVALVLGAISGNIGAVILNGLASKIRINLKKRKRRDDN